MADVDIALRQAFEQVFGSVKARLPRSASQAIRNHSSVASPEDRS
jgi:hypothetical protein